ncbi:hypothetical protein PPL_11831 [Heterostelium album PN500]|uniref:EGF-like domain-containing protein n=1 Tax=Heterostelium pallidum (strain ATCC 26659 / Pp 5 / PN500) TaxID=670386 RepID=D3BUL0_HETP5|nr:hypothetical protein PPL_11831 [Heterostelium album PN500]EFA74798.1 hypothetical protein PPL_11831 [Heterostelium album PN500]|eukprot:XP_020426932.1 hypothetical protein PPL_11831 [Heterostelium album PN500]
MNLLLILLLFISFIFSGVICQQEIFEFKYIEDNFNLTGSTQRVSFLIKVLDPTANYSIEDPNFQCSNLKKQEQNRYLHTCFGLVFLEYNAGTQNIEFIFNNGSNIQNSLTLRFNIDFPPDLQIGVAKFIRYPNSNHLTIYAQTNYTTKAYPVRLDLVNMPGCYYALTMMTRLPGNDGVYFADISPTGSGACTILSSGTLRVRLSGFNSSGSVDIDIPASYFPSAGVAMGTHTIYPSRRDVYDNDYIYWFGSLTNLNARSALSYQPAISLSQLSNSKVVTGNYLQSAKVLGIYNPDTVKVPKNVSMAFFDVSDNKTIYATNYYTIQTSGNNVPILDIYPTLIEFIQFEKVNSYSFLIQMKVIDPDGCVSIEFSNGVSIGYRDMIEGDYKNGVYEKVLNYTSITDTVYVLSIKDILGNIVQWRSEIDFSTNQQLLPKYPSIFGETNMKNITMFTFDNLLVNSSPPPPTTPTPTESPVVPTRPSANKFESLQVLDDSSFVARNILRFNFSNSDPNIEPFIIVDFSYFEFENRTQIFKGFWNTTGLHYQVSITIPENLASREIVVTLPMSYYFTSSQISYLDYKSFSVQTFNCDQLPPMILSVELSQANPYYFTGGTNFIGWKITIEDSPNYFVNGTFLIQGSIDKYQYNLSVSNPNMVVGSNIYYINIPVTFSTPSQMFDILSMELVDSSGNIASNMIGSKTPLFNPYMINQLYNSRIIFLNANQTNGNDFSMPEILSMNFSPNVIDVGDPNPLKRQLTVSGLFRSNISGINSEKYPIVSSTFLGKTLSFQIDNVQAYNLSTVMFTKTIEIPYGFTIPSTWDLSISYVCSFNGNCLNSTFGSLQFIYSYLPILESNSFIDRNGGEIFIYGQKFGNQSDFKGFVSYENGQYQPFQVNFFSDSIFSFTMNASNAVKIIVQSKLGYSNVLVILGSNEQQPTIPPETTCGDPKCGGNGKCVDALCQCNEGWSGPSCQSKFIPQPPPNVDPKSPTTTTDNSNVQLIGTIKIEYINELKPSGEIFKQYKLADWKGVKAITSDRFLQYNYTKSIGEIDTNITVVVQWFGETRNVEFAGLNSTMTPGSIKYSVIMDRYIFDSPLNILQVVIEVEVVEMNKDGCIEKQTSPRKNDIQWVKIRVSDQSFYCRFLNRALVDSRSTAITNTLLDGGGNQSDILNSKVGMMVPFYENQVIIDPDFSIIIDTESDNSKCGVKSGDNNQWRKIVGIVIGSVLGVAIIVSVSLYLYKRNIVSKENKRMSNKLKRLSSNEA